MRRHTRKIPWLTLVKININHHRTTMKTTILSFSCNFFCQVITNKFFIPWVESKSRRQFWFHHTQETHPFKLMNEKNIYIDRYINKNRRKFWRDWVFLFWRWSSKWGINKQLELIERRVYGFPFPVSLFRYSVRDDGMGTTVPTKLFLIFFFKVFLPLYVHPKLFSSLPKYPLTI